MDNILIAFTADTGGLDETNKKLDELKDKEHALIQQMKELEKEKNVRKFYAQTASEQAKAEQEYGKKISKTRNELSQNKKSIEELSKAQKKLSEDIPTKVVEKSFREIRKEIENQVKTMTMLEQTDTKEYQKLIEKAGKLSDIQGDVQREIKGLASDTGAFDTILEGTQLMAGGFSVAQGAMAMFGAEGEDIQKMMMKLQSAIAITTGLQQVQNAMQKESYVLRLINNTQLKLGVIATNLDTASKSKNIIVSKSATAAQWLLNAAAAANPYVLLTMALITVVGALVLFTMKTESASEKQAKANELDQIRLEQLERLNQKTNELSEKNIKRLENELSVMQKMGSSQKDLAKKQEDILLEKIKMANYNYGYYKDEINNIDKNKTKLEELKESLDKLNAAKLQGNKKVEIKVDGKLQKVKVNDDDVRNAIQSSIDNTEFKIKLGVDAKEGKDSVDQANKEFMAEQAKKAKEMAKSEATAAAEVRLLEAKKGSKEELAARIESFATEKRIALQNTELTASQRKKILIETDKAIQDAKREFEIKELENEKLYNEAKRAQAVESSDEEFAYQLEVMKNTLEIGLHEKDITDAKRFNLETNYQKEVDKLTKEHNAKRNQVQLNFEISLINAKLTTVNKGGIDEYNLKLTIIDKQAELEKQEAKTSIKNKEELASKLTEIDANSNQEKKNILSNLIDYEAGIDKQRLDLEKVQNELILDSYSNSFKERSKARKALYNNELYIIKIEKNALEDKHRNGVISEEEYQKELTDIQMHETKDRLDKEREAERIKSEIRQESFETLSTIVNSSYEIQLNNLNQQLNDLQNYYTTDAEEAKKNKDLKLISEQEYAEKENKIKSEIAKKEKQQAVVTAMMNSANAIIKAFMQYGWPLGLVFAALTAAQTAAQISVINSQKPAYWKGRKGGKGELSWVGEQGPELMWLPSGASIVPARQSQMIANGDENMMRDWNIPMISNIPELPSIHQNVVNEFANKNQIGINYDILAKKIGLEMKRNVRIPQSRGDVHVKIDNNGITVSRNGNITNVKNGKYGV